MIVPDTQAQTRQKSLYLTKSACHFGRYSYVRLQLSAALAGNIFQYK